MTYNITITTITTSVYKVDYREAAAPRNYGNLHNKCISENN